MSAAALFSVEHLRVDIPTAAGTLHAVRDVSFTLEAGKILGIVGESGAGKSLTRSRCLACCRNARAAAPRCCACAIATCSQCRNATSRHRFAGSASR